MAGHSGSQPVRAMRRERRVRVDNNLWVCVDCFDVIIIINC
jgi:hypothetical protein